MAGSWTSARRDGDALLHAARQLPRIPALEAGEADEGQELAAPPRGALAVEALDVDRQQHVVEHRPPGEEHRRLEDDADVAARAGDGRAAQAGLAAEGGRSPARILSSVVLPQPEGPTTATNSPSPTSKLMPSSAATLPSRVG